LLAELLSVPLDGGYPALDLTPQRKKEKTFDGLLRQLAGSARQRSGTAGLVLAHQSLGRNLMWGGRFGSSRSHSRGFDKSCAQSAKPHLCCASLVSHRPAIVRA